MIKHHGYLAVDLSQIKAIKTELLKQEGNLIFKCNNMIVPVLNEEAGDFEMKSFANDPVSDGLSAYF